MNVLKSIFLSTTFVLINGSYAADVPKLTEQTKILLSQAKSKVKGISSAELKKQLEEKQIVLIDVRDPDEWKNSIEYEKQVHISRGFLEIKYPNLILNKYSVDDKFVVYCALGPRSIFAAERLQELGFKNVSFLEGGLASFK